MEFHTWLNIAFLILTALLAVQFVRTGGSPMLRMMGGSPDTQQGEHEHYPGEHGHRHGQLLSSTN